MVYIICTYFAPTPLLEVRNAELYEYWCPNAKNTVRRRAGCVFSSAGPDLCLASGL